MTWRVSSARRRPLTSLTASRYLYPPRPLHPPSHGLPFLVRKSQAAPEAGCQGREARGQACQTILKRSFASAQSPNQGPESDFGLLDPVIDGFIDRRRRLARPKPSRRPLTRNPPRSKPLIKQPISMTLLLPISTRQRMMPKCIHVLYHQRTISHDDLDERESEPSCSAWP